MIKIIYKPLTDDQLPEAWQKWLEANTEPEYPSESEFARRLTEGVK